MKSSYFQDAVESSAKVIGRKDVNVVFEGERAETDGNTVYLPALPPSSEITIDQAEIVRGFRDHETMHVRCTDTSKASMKRLAEVETNNKSLARLVQYCEDIRIEHAGVQEYAGMKTSLSAIQTHAAKMLIEQLEGMGKPEEVITKTPRNIQLRVLLQTMGRSKVGVTSGGLFETLCEAIKQADPKLHQFASEWSDKMASLPTGYNGKTLVETTSKKGTEKSFELADSIYKAFGELDDTPPPPPPPPPGEGEGDGPPNDCKGEGEGQGKGEGEGEGQGKGKSDGDGGKTSHGEPVEDEDDDPDEGNAGGGGEDDEEDKDEDEEQDGNPSGSEDEDDSDSEDDDQGSDGDGGHGDSDPDTNPQQAGDGGNSHGNNMGVLPEDAVNVDDLFKDALKDIVKDIHDHGPDLKLGGQKKKRFKVYSRRFSSMLPPIEAVVASQGSRADDQSIIKSYRRHGMEQMARFDKDLAGKKAMIRRLLEVELQARSDRRWENGFKSGRLQSVRLVQAIQGRETVYQRRDSGKDMDTLLYVSIDGSGSMSGSRMTDAVKLAYALSEALERTGCDIIVVAWGNCCIGTNLYKKSAYTKADYENATLKMASDSRASGVTDVVSTGLLTRALIKSKRQRTTDDETRAGFGVASLGLNSSTPSYHAIFEDLHDMGKESHSKKIYLHITDGDPDTAMNGATVIDLMKEAHDYGAALKIHLIGVGIAGMKVGHMFPDNVEVASSDAYEPVIKKLAKLVAEESGHAASFKRTA